MRQKTGLLTGTAICALLASTALGAASILPQDVPQRLNTRDSMVQLAQNAEEPEPKEQEAGEAPAEAEEQTAAPAEAELDKEPQEQQVEKVAPAPEPAAEAEETAEKATDDAPAAATGKASDKAEKASDEAADDVTEQVEDAETVVSEPEAEAPAKKEVEAEQQGGRKAAKETTEPAEAVTDEAMEPAGEKAGDTAAETEADIKRETAKEPAAERADKAAKRAERAGRKDRTESDVTADEGERAPILDSQKGRRAGEEPAEGETTAASEEQAPPPDSDADAQAAIETDVKADVEAAITEEGRRIDAPRWFRDRLGDRNGDRDEARDGDRDRDGDRYRDGDRAGRDRDGDRAGRDGDHDREVVRVYDDRIVFRIGDEIRVEYRNRGDRITRDARDVYYEELRHGRVREVVTRRNGVKIVTVYNREGDILQRVKILPDGREIVLVHVDRSHYDEVGDRNRAGRRLPPLRLTIPARDYILEAERVRDRDTYYEFLRKPPVERVERTYSISEVTSSPRIRDKVRRIDLDTINFEFGSAEVTQEELPELDGIAWAIQQMLENNPGETFLVEGHTDAVGSEIDNMALSDRRAWAVVDALTDYYDIPPENLVPQGYGEEYLKVQTQAPNRENRRVAIRRITPLVAPVASTD